MKAFVLLVTLLVITACDNFSSRQNRNITMEAFSSLRTPAYVIHPDVVCETIARKGHATADSSSVDNRIFQYYKGGGALIWVDRKGIDERADTLLRHLHRLNRIGFSEARFDVKKIEDDMQRLRKLDFDERDNKADDVVARLEYHLTKAALRYTAGQQYGFVNPHVAINRVETETDSTGHVVTKYIHLFDIPVMRPNQRFYAQAIRKIQADSLSELLAEVERQNDLYHRLEKRLDTATSEVSRQKILVNMERCRWQEPRPVPKEGKRIIVNIPAFYLYAYGPDSTLSMKIGCGATKTKTPLLTSEIEYMQINPEWNIPQSIINNDVARHAGDSGYFARHRYYIAERATGKKVGIHSVSKAMLTGGKYRVSQEGGPGNSLGRIIFRFKNNFSVYLHDTSTRGFFQSSWRGISHGCVRVERPFELACFLLGDVDEWTLDKIRISMDMRPSTEQGRRYVRDHADDEEKVHRLINSHGVNPHVPVYIIYYTLYPDTQGQIQEHPDVYGYDERIWNYLKTYI